MNLWSTGEEAVSSQRVSRRLRRRRRPGRRATWRSRRRGLPSSRNACTAPRPLERSTTCVDGCSAPATWRAPPWPAGGTWRPCRTRPGRTRPCGSCSWSSSAPAAPGIITHFLIPNEQIRTDDFQKKKKKLERSQRKGGGMTKWRCPRSSVCPWSTFIVCLFYTVRLLLALFADSQRLLLLEDLRSMFTITGSVLCETSPSQTMHKLDGLRLGQTKPPSPSQISMLCFSL